MSTFKDYLTESAKSYDYKIKVAGELEEGFANKLESALAKFEVAKMSAGKKTPIMTMPLDFPRLSNEQVTIFDVTTNYPASQRVMHEYLSDILRIPATHIVVRKPGEPTEQYQAEKDDAPYEAKLNSPYEDSKDEQKSSGSTRVMDLLKQLEKERKGKKTQRS